MPDLLGAKPSTIATNKLAWGDKLRFPDIRQAEPELPDSAPETSPVWR